MSRLKKAKNVFCVLFLSKTCSKSQYLKQKNNLTKEKIFNLLGYEISDKECIYHNPLGESCDKLFKNAIEFASRFDRKILIEEGLVGKEVECAVLGNEEVEASCVGEIKPAEDFYTFDAKYKNQA